MANRDIGYRPTDAVLRRRLKQFVDERGERLALEALGIPKQTLARALSGLNVRRGTIALVTMALDNATRVAS